MNRNIYLTRSKEEKAEASWPLSYHSFFIKMNRMNRIFFWENSRILLRCKVGSVSSELSTNTVGFGKSPSHLPLGYQIQSRLDRCFPDKRSRMTAEGENLPFRPFFKVGDKVFGRNFGHGPKRVPVNIRSMEGSRMVSVQMTSGEVRRNVDQVHRWRTEDPLGFPEWVVSTHGGAWWNGGATTQNTNVRHRGAYRRGSSCSRPGDIANTILHFFESFYEPGPISVIFLKSCSTS